MCNKRRIFTTQEKIKKSWLKSRCALGLSNVCFMNYILPYVGSEEISISLFKVVIFICGGGFFGITMYLFGLWNLKIILINKNHLYIKLQFYILFIFPK